MYKNLGRWTIAILVLVVSIYIALWHVWGTGWTEAQVSHAAREATLDVIVLEKLRNNQVDAAIIALENQLNLHIAEGVRDVTRLEGMFPLGMKSSATAMDMICGEVAPYRQQYPSSSKRESKVVKKALEAC